MIRVKYALTRSHLSLVSHDSLSRCSGSYHRLQHLTKARFNRDSRRFHFTAATATAKLLTVTIVLDNRNRDWPYDLARR